MVQKVLFKPYRVSIWKNQMVKEEGSDPLVEATLSQPIGRCAEVLESLKMTHGSS